LERKLSVILSKYQSRKLAEEAESYTFKKIEEEETVRKKKV
jgi:hypothetical protein